MKGEEPTLFVWCSVKITFEHLVNVCLFLCVFVSSIVLRCVVCGGGLPVLWMHWIEFDWIAYYRCLYRAEQRDYSVIEELLALLQDPYALLPLHSTGTDIDVDATDSAAAHSSISENEAGAVAETAAFWRRMEDKYYRKTPPWAQSLPGVTFMS
jgi:hypothetical protein